jgi:hypothetical protein
VIKAPEAAGHDPVAVSKHVNAQLVVDGSIRRDGKHSVSRNGVYQDWITGDRWTWWPS